MQTIIIKFAHFPSNVSLARVTSHFECALKIREHKPRKKVVYFAGGLPQKGRVQTNFVCNYTSDKH